MNYYAIPGFVVSMGETVVTKDKLKGLIEYICKMHDGDINLFYTKTRKREVVTSRQTAMYVLKNFTKLSLANIGKCIADKDHATVLHACKTINNLKDSDKNFKLIIENIDNHAKMILCRTIA